MLNCSKKKRFGTGCKGYRSFALTAPSNRNPQGVTLPRYLRLIAAGAVEASLSSLTTFAVRNPRGATCSCTTRDLLLQRLSKLSAFIRSCICFAGFTEV